MQNMCNWIFFYQFKYGVNIIISFNLLEKNKKQIFLLELKAGTPVSKGSRDTNLRSKLKLSN